LTNRDEWQGMIRGRRNPTGILTMVAPLGTSPGGGSGSFPCLASDGQKWFVKAPNQSQGGMVLVTEYIVGRLGRLIEAPTCRGEIIEVPSDLAGFEFQPGAKLAAGYGHGTLMISAAVEVRGTPGRRFEDDNRQRHVGIFALYDWCWGSDEQWLHCTTDDWRIYSHDHGWYLPPSGPSWDAASLMTSVHVPHPLPADAAGLDSETAADVASRLDALDRTAVRDVLMGVPLAWGVEDTDLEVLGWFLEERAPDVAARLRAL
jgi:hypothetical protein